MILNTGIKKIPLTILFIFGISACLFLLIAWQLHSTVNIVWGLVLSATVLFSLYYYTRPARRYLLPLIFTLFCLLGIIVDYGVILFSQDTIPRIGYLSIGQFDFSVHQTIRVVLVIFFGFCGIMAAVLLAEKFLPRVLSGWRSDFTETARPPRSIKKMTLIWILFSALLILIMWFLKIGRVGLKNGTILPFRLNGLFFYLRVVFVPFFGMFLFDVIDRYSDSKLKKNLFLLILLLALAGSLGSLSRSYYVRFMAPACLLSFFSFQKKDLARKTPYIFTFLVFVSFVLCMEGIQILRGYLYNIDQAAGAAVTTPVSKSHIIKNILTLATSRVGGVRKLMAVISSGITGFIETASIFLTRTERIDQLNISVFGFTPVSDQIRSFGISYGIWGMLALSGNYLIVFLGTFLCSWLIIFIEEIFIRVRLFMVSCFFSFLMAFSFWDEFYMFTLTRILILTVICFLFVFFLNWRKAGSFKNCSL